MLLELARGEAIPMIPGFYKTFIFSNNRKKISITIVFHAVVNVQNTNKTYNT